MGIYGYLGKLFHGALKTLTEELESHLGSLITQMLGLVHICSQPWTSTSWMLQQQVRLDDHSSILSVLQLCDSVFLLVFLLI